MANVRQGKVALNSTTSSTQAVAYAANCVADSALFLVTVSTVTAETISSIADTLSNTWTSVAAVTVGSFRFEVWKASNTGGAGANTITATFGGAITASTHRFWVFEATGLGTLSNGPNNTLDQTSTVTTFPCATLSTTTVGIAFTVLRFDGSAFTYPATSVQLWQEAAIAASQFGSWADCAGGSFDRCALRFIDNESVTLTPTFILAGARSGESLTAAIYGTVASGGSGGNAGSFG